MIKTVLKQQLGEALAAAAPELNNLAVDAALIEAFKLERPRDASHGDYAVNVSSLARHTKMPPPKIAETVKAHFPAEGFEVTTAGGYLNFRLTNQVLQQALTDIVRAEKPGLNDTQKDLRALIEYVSANPTGPLHIGHGRWAALGNTLQRILEHCGAYVTPEFYINDFGFQMEKMALSVWWRAVEILKNEGALDGVNPEYDILSGRELPYPGEFVIAFAFEYLQTKEHREAVLADWSRYQGRQAERGDEVGDVTDLPEWSTNIKQRIIDEVAPRVIAQQQALLTRLRVTFDEWYSEKQRLHEKGLVEDTLDKLKEHGYTYELEGALWFRSTEFGDEKDRVLKKSDGSYTYLSADIAYHDDKYNRPEKYNRIINIWGADHHGYIARLRGAMEALRHDASQFEIVLGQLVKLIVDGERARMGKRRKMVTLEDLVEEVGVDATRFWMVSRSSDVTLDFDVDLAGSATSDNPVFYVQYAHARCASILRNAVESAPNIDTGEMAAPYVQAEELEALANNLSASDMAILFESADDAAKEAIKTLLISLDNFGDIVADAARLRAPHFLTQYSMDVSSLFHSFYNVCRVLTPETEVTKARLMLILALKKTLAQALDLLGVSAPEKM